VSSRYWRGLLYRGAIGKAGLWLAQRLYLMDPQRTAFRAMGYDAAALCSMSEQTLLVSQMKISRRFRLVQNFFDAERLHPARHRPVDLIAHPIAQHRRSHRRED
jgi:hypothetical protein